MKHETAPAGAHPVSMLLYTCRSTSGSPMSAGGRLPGVVRRLSNPSFVYHLQWRAERAPGGWALTAAGCQRVAQAHPSGRSG